MPRPHWHPAWKIESTPTTVLLAAAAAVLLMSYSNYPLERGGNIGLLLGYLCLLIFCPKTLFESMKIGKTALLSNS